MTDFWFGVIVGASGLGGGVAMLYGGKVAAQAAWAKLVVLLKAEAAKL